MKKIICHTLLLATLISCGKKSEITPIFEAIPLKDSHGDGKYAVFTVKLPLSDQSLASYDSPLDPSQGVSRIPLIGDVLRLVTQSSFNLGAQLGLGKQNIIINQPLPDLETPYLNSISIKRVFFHIDQKKVVVEQAPSMWERFRDFLRGGSKTDFSFIKELSINFRAVLLDEAPSSLVPEVITDVDPKRDLLSAEEIANLPRALRPVEILKYVRKNRDEALLNKDRGAMFVVYGESPVRLRSVLKRVPDIGVLVKEMVVINKTLFVELNANDKESQEKFNQILDDNEAELSDAGIVKVDACDADTCMDVKVNNQNMLPLLKSGNQLRIETFINSSKVPSKSFQLKGFIEFEVKLDVPL